MSDFLQLFLIGIVSSYGACFVTCWPIALPYVTATGEGLRSRLYAALAFLSAKLVVYVMLGTAAAFLGRIMTGWIAQHAHVLFVVSGIAIIILGLRAALTGTHPCRVFLKRLKVKAKIESAALLGIFAGILPCATSTAVIAYIAFSAESPLMGAALGFAFGVGKFFSPLIPASILTNYFQNRFKINQLWIRYACALLIFILGLRLIQKGTVLF